MRPNYMRRSRKMKVDRALRNASPARTSMPINGGETAFVLAPRAERTVHLRLLFAVVAGALSILSLPAPAQNAEKIAQREVARRQAAMPQGTEALARGKAAMQEKNLTLAHEEFRTAVNFLPDAVTSGKSHDEAVDGFCKSGVK